MINGKKILAVTPARGGSKGIPRKNIKLLNGKPLIQWTYEKAIKSKYIDKVILSSEDDEIINSAKEIGFEIPFKRPSHLASDTASTKDVLLHVVNFFAEREEHYDYIVLLQPTSPFRDAKHIDESIEQMEKYGPDMVVSVKETSSNPYYVLFEENENGFLDKSKEGHYTRRQDCPIVYEYNGSIYVIKIEELINQNTMSFRNKMKYLMEDGYLSIDLDTPFDWSFAEYIANEFKL